MSSDSRWPWSNRPVTMGVINASPDSFYQDSIYDQASRAASKAEEMVQQGARIIDIGAEGSSPEADQIDVEKEIDTLEPYVESCSDVDALVSVDTYKSDVAETMLDLGVDIINDASGLDDPEMIDVVSDYDAGLVINHSTNPIVTDENYVREYDDVVAEVKDYLKTHAAKAEDAGVDPEDIIVDPGFGFQKTPTYNIELVRRFDEITDLEYAVLSGPSRKPVFAQESNTDSFLPHTLAVTAITTRQGADIVRIHDVPENEDAIAIGHMSKPGGIGPEEWSDD